MDLKKNVKIILKAQGMTTLSFAAKMGVTRSQIYSYFENPRLSNIEKMAEALGVSPAEILSPEGFSEVNYGVCPHCGKRIYVSFHK